MEVTDNNEVELDVIVEESTSSKDHSSNSAGGSESESPSQTQTDVNGSRKKRSGVYEHFLFVEAEKKYKCKSCKKMLTQVKGNSTCNLLRHLKSFHPGLLDKANAKPNLPQSILDFIKSKDVLFSQAELEERIIDFILKTNQPFTIVEEKSFRALITLCRPSANFFSADTAKRKILRRFDVEKEQLLCLLHGIDSKISFVIDCWTSSTQVPFQGIIGRWIDSEWKYRHRIIDLDILTGRHTGAVLAQSFISVIEEFGISDKIIAITTDNASNCDTFFASLQDSLQKKGIDFQEKNKRVRCLAHIINLACQDAISVLRSNSNSSDPTQDGSESEEESDSDSDSSYAVPSVPSGVSVFHKIRLVVVKIRKSTQRRESFRKQCEVNGIKPKELVKDVSTRWNSTYLMLKRALKLKVPYENTLRGQAKLKQFLLSDPEWERVAEVVSFLKPFQKMTTHLSHEKIPSMSLSVMVYMQLYNHLEGISEVNGHSNLLVNASEKACSKLNKYYPSSDGEVFVLGTILDPRCKMTWYSCNSVHFPTSLVKTYKAMIRNVWEKNYKHDPTTIVSEGAAVLSNNPTRVKEKPEDLFSIQMKRAKIDKRDELQVYLDECAVPHVDASLKNGVLEWWKDRQSVFPNLSKMARDYLAVSGTGVPIERFFSHGPDLLSSKRRAMHGDTIRKCMCLHGWISSKNEEEFEKFIAADLQKKMFGIRSTTD